MHLPNPFRHCATATVRLLRVLLLLSAMAPLACPGQAITKRAEHEAQRERLKTLRSYLPTATKIDPLLPYFHGVMEHCRDDVLPVSRYPIATQESMEKLYVSMGTPSDVEHNLINTTIQKLGIETSLGRYFYALSLAGAVHDPMTIKERQQEIRVAKEHVAFRRELNELYEKMQEGSLDIMLLAFCAEHQNLTGGIQLFRQALSARSAFPPEALDMIEMFTGSKDMEEYLEKTKSGRHFISFTNFTHMPLDGLSRIAMKVISMKLLWNVWSGVFAAIKQLWNGGNAHLLASLLSIENITWVFLGDLLLQRVGVVAGSFALLLQGNFSLGTFLWALTAGGDPSRSIVPWLQDKRRYLEKYVQDEAHSSNFALYGLGQVLYLVVASGLLLVNVYITWDALSPTWRHMQYLQAKVNENLSLLNNVVGTMHDLRKAYLLLHRARRILIQEEELATTYGEALAGLEAVTQGKELAPLRAFMRKVGKLPKRNLTFADVWNPFNSPAADILAAGQEAQEMLGAYKETLLKAYAHLCYLEIPLRIARHLELSEQGLLKEQPLTMVRFDEDPRSMPRLVIRNTYSPLFSPSKTVCNDVALGIDQEACNVIIQGINGGGKSGYLQAIGQNMVVITWGVCFGSDAEATSFDHLSFVGENKQDVKAGHSSFMAQLHNLNRVTTYRKRHPEQKMMILGDESLAGTEELPAIHMLLSTIRAWHLPSGGKDRTISVVATHRDIRSTAGQMQKRGLKYYTIGYDEAHGYTYRIIEGAPTYPVFMAAAHAVGFDEAVLKDAVASLNRDSRYRQRHILRHANLKPQARKERKHGKGGLRMRRRRKQ